LDPFLLTLDIHSVGLLTHTSEFTNCLDTLEYHSAFKDNQHEKSKQRVVPVLIQTPQTNAENLKHEEGSYGVFLEKFNKSRDRDIKADEGNLVYAQKKGSTG
jgi:hypothetical protein